MGTTLGFSSLMKKLILRIFDFLHKVTIAYGLKMD